MNNLGLSWYLAWLRPLNQPALLLIGLASLIPAIMIWTASEQLTAVLWVGFVLLALLCINWLRRWATIFIQERNIGIIFTKRGNFVAFIPAGLHIIDKRFLELKAEVPTYTQRINEKTTDYRTKEGILVSASWETEYTINTERLLLHGEAKDAYGLLKLPPKKIIKFTLGAIRHLFESRTIEELYNCNNRDDCLFAELNDTLTERVQAALADDVNLVEGSGKVLLGSIIFPEQIEHALESMHERRLYTTAVNDSLKQIEDSIKTIDNEKVRHLSELERLRVFAKHGLLIDEEKGYGRVYKARNGSS